MWKQAVSTADEWTQDMGSVYTAIFLGHEKRGYFVPFATSRMDLEGLTLSDISQAKTNTVRDPFYVEPTKKFRKK